MGSAGESAATATGGSNLDLSSSSNAKYHLRWQDYPHSVVTSFRHLKEDEDFVDVTLACNSQQFTAHKVVLSACSPYFKKLLKVRLNGHDENPSRMRNERAFVYWCSSLFLETLDYLMRWGIAKLPTVETLLNSSFPIRNPLSTTCFIFMQLLIKQLEYARGAPAAAEENNSQMNLNFGVVF